MSKRDVLYNRAIRWVKNWCSGRSKPTLEMAYIAGYQAAWRDINKANQKFQPMKDAQK